MTSSKSAARNSRYPLGNTDALKTFILVECPFTEPHHTVREGDTLQTLTIVRFKERGYYYAREVLNEYLKRTDKKE